MSHSTQSKAIRSIIKVLLNVHRFGKKRCALCNSNLYNSLSHILFQCQCSIDKRNELWNELFQSCTGSLRVSLNSMSNEAKTKFLINGFYSPYNNEWDEIYSHIVKYVNILVDEHINATKDLLE